MWSGHYQVSNGWFDSLIATHHSNSGSFQLTRKLDLHPEDFTEDGVLRVGFLLWAVMLFLNRHLILLAFGAVTNLVGSRSGLDSGSLIALYSSPWFLLASLPALAVLLTALRRDRKAGRLIRSLWCHGRWLLAISAGLDLALLIAFGTLTQAEINELHLVGGILDSYVLVYLRRSAWAQARFADFPEPRKQIR
jgi:hypothetical protein